MYAFYRFAKYEGRLDEVKNVNLPEPVNFISASIENAYCCMRPAKMELMVRNETGTLSIKNDLVLKNSHGFPIAKVILDCTMDLDHTIAEVLARFDSTVHCVQTAAEETADELSLQTETSESKKHVSISVDGLIVKLLEFRSSIVFRRIGIF